MGRMGIYLDHAATTPVDPEVIEAMLPYLAEVPYNASAIHTGGRMASEAVEEARSRVARFIGADPDEVYFTSGGTESDNWALKSVRHVPVEQKPHLLVSAIEHAAVLESADTLARAGWMVERVPVTPEGRVEPDQVALRITSQTALVSVMLANNEVGTIQPIADIAAECRKRSVLVHTDAVQAGLYVRLDVDELGVDLLTLSAHKLYGPKGIGALYIRRGTAIRRWMDGGSHERGMRSGTINVPAAVGFGVACDLAVKRRDEDGPRVAERRDRLVEGIMDRVPECRLTGWGSDLLPGHAHFCFRGVEGESVLIGLDAAGVYASGGAACSSRSVSTSHVLRAMGMADEWARGAVRMTLGRSTTPDQIEYTIDAVASALADLRF